MSAPDALRHALRHQLLSRPVGTRERADRIWARAQRLANEVNEHASTHWWRLQSWREAALEIEEAIERRKKRTGRSSAPALEKTLREYRLMVGYNEADQRKFLERDSLPWVSVPGQSESGVYCWMTEHSANVGVVAIFDEDQRCVFVTHVVGTPLEIADYVERVLDWQGDDVEKACEVGRLTERAPSRRRAHA